jgi:glycosyltransferase involved in cell wall biosynthesis
LKILRIIDSMSPAIGGPSEGIRNIIPEMAKHGITNEVVCFDDPLEPFIVASTFKIHALGKGFSKWSYNKFFENWLEKNYANYNLIIIHGLWLYQTYAVYRLINKIENKNSSQKFFGMPHGMLDPYFQYAKTRKIKAFRNYIYWHLIESKYIKSLDGVLFTSDIELQNARKTFSNYQPKKEIMCSYGINDLSNTTIKNETGNYLLFLGRIDSKKGIDLIIKAYEKLVNSSSIELPQLIITGSIHDKDYFNYCTEIATKNKKLKDKISFRNFVQGEEKIEIINNCKALILPSHQENFGISVAEALSFGKPVLISNKVNIHEIILRENCGFVEENSVEGCIKLITSFVSLTPPQMNEMNLNAKQAFKRNFSIENYCQNLIKLLN